MHVPQSLQTRYELEWITLVPTQIFTPQGGQGIISLVFDSLTGMYRFSRQNKPLTGDMVQNLLMVSPIWNGKMIEADMDSQWSPSAMYSMLLPMFSYKGKNGLYNDNPVEENEVVIEKGRVRMGGVFDKSVLGPSQNAIMKTLGFWYGNWAAKNYIDNTQQMVNDWLSTSGLSVGIGDVIAPLPVLERITQEVQKGIQDVNQILEQAHHGLFEPNLQSEYFFKSLENAIQKCTAMTGDKIANLLMKDLDPNNRFLEMVACGARGNKGNLQQTTGIVGQQTIDGKRTQFHFTARTLPHFTKDDFSAQSRGFIVHSFTEGLAPTEYFFHQMASREGTIDTAIKTADVGYIQRRLIKAMEDINIQYDLTVRSAAKSIIQFRYGDDGYDAMTIQKQKLELFEKSFTEMQNDYDISAQEWSSWEKLLVGDMKKQWKSQGMKEKERAKTAFDELVETQKEMRQIDFKYAKDADFGSTLFCPVHFPRLIQKVKDLYATGGAPEVMPSKVIDTINELITELTGYMPDYTLNRFKAQLKSMICVKRVVVKERWSQEAFAGSIREIREYFMKGICQPGEMIGTLTAEMLGEPLTQLTLNTFHSAGRADAGAVTTTGVPRMKEIVNLAGKQKQKQIKTPSMTIYLRDPWRSDLNKAKELKSILEFTKLGDLVTQTKILFDPVQSVFESGSQRAPGVDFEEEDEFTRLYYSFSEAVGAPTADPSNTSPWVLRMEFDRDKMVSHNITMADIRRVLTSNEELNQDISITFSDDNAGDLVMRVRVNSIQEDTDPVAFLQMMAHKNLMNVTIQGIQGISLAVPKKVNTLYYNADGKPDMRSDWIIQTDGVNIFEVLMMDFVDAERMMCNDINMVKEIFGIEAARAILVHEFGVLLSESVSDLNYRHISVVCDVMAYRGDLMSIDRHGLKRSPDISAFAKASNEESVEILVNAGVFADTDRMTGVSSNILMGQQPNGGTNAFEILLDESNLVDKVEVSAPDYRPSTIYEEVGEATTWGAEDDVVEEVVESAHPEYQGFMANDPFEIQFEGDRLDRLGRLDVETTIPRPPLFKSTQKWVNVDES